MHQGPAAGLAVGVASRQQAGGLGARAPHNSSSARHQAAAPPPRARPADPIGPWDELCSLKTAPGPTCSASDTRPRASHPAPAAVPAQAFWRSGACSSAAARALLMAFLLRPRGCAEALRAASAWPPEVCGRELPQRLMPRRRLMWLVKASAVKAVQGQSLTAAPEAAGGAAAPRGHLRACRPHLSAAVQPSHWWQPFSLPAAEQAARVQRCRAHACMPPPQLQSARMATCSMQVVGRARAACLQILCRHSNSSSVLQCIRLACEAQADRL